ncbi:MAG: MarR family winged helix-turn-helix transcriptional regulator [Spirochaetia bacterium]
MSSENTDLYTDFAELLKRLKLLMAADAPALQAGLSGSLAAALDEIESSPGIGVAALSEALGITAASASALVRKLAAKKLVVKQESSADGRAVELFVTPAGKVLTKKIRNYRKNFARRMLTPLRTEEQADLMRIFRKSIESLSEVKG